MKIYALYIFYSKTCCLWDWACSLGSYLYNSSLSSPYRASCTWIKNNILKCKISSVYVHMHVREKASKADPITSLRARRVMQESKHQQLIYSATKNNSVVNTVWKSKTAGIAAMILLIHHALVFRDETLTQIDSNWTWRRASILHLLEQVALTASPWQPDRACLFIEL